MEHAKIINLPNNFLNQGNENYLCGYSNWKAARSDASYKKNLDITGLEMMSCTRGSVVNSANLFVGQTFKNTHLQYLKTYKWGKVVL